MMNDNFDGRRSHLRPRLRRRRAAVVIIVMAGVALPAAGCGGGSPSSATAGRPTQHGSGLAYTHCMRSHGVPNFPDPNSSGTWPSAQQLGLGPHDPQYRAAIEACQPVLPNLTAAQHAQAESKALNFADCMRSHRVTDFPDPVTGSNDGVGWILPGNIDVTSPAFQRAAQACKHFVGGNFETSHAPLGHPNKAGP
jgi:hypothetical protein